MSSHTPTAVDRNALVPPQRVNREGRSASNSNVGLRPLATSFAPAHSQPGSFNPDLKTPSTLTNRVEFARPELNSFTTFRPQRREDVNSPDDNERRQAEIKDQIEKETKIKTGSENLLEALNLKSSKQTREQRLRVESELNTSNKKIAQLKQDLAAELERARESSPSRLSQLFKTAAPARSPSHHELEDPFETESESPTFLLAELLQALEIEGRPSEYYVERSNNLVELFKRHSTLKYDLVWSIFGTRMQTLLLHESREVVAASYRVLRHVITDRRSLSIIRSLHTDYLVILSLVKESKASVEREQALKFVRAFLDVKNGTAEISKSVVRVIVAVAQHSDDRLRNICILTLAELLIRDPSLVVDAGGMTVLIEAFVEREYHSSQGLIQAILYLTDTPKRRVYLKSGHELEGPFSVFTDASAEVTEEQLKASAKSISILLKSWPGLFALSRNGFVPIKSLMASTKFPLPHLRDIALELFFDVLRIKHPSWSSSFLAGRRLTSYGRVANMTPDPAHDNDAPQPKRNELVEHFTALVLAVLLQSGLLSSLTFIIQDESNAAIRRKATLLLAEVLNLVHDLLPNDWNLNMQILPSLFQPIASLSLEERHICSSAIYQIDSVNRTLHRSGRTSNPPNLEALTQDPKRQTDGWKGDFTPQIDENLFRAAVLETQVLNHSNYSKWRWDLIQKIVEGPLLNPRRFEESVKSNKFVKRVIGFYRPFKYRFTEVRNSKPHQRYVRVGCSLIRTLLATAEGFQYLAENKLLRQIAECLAQVDHMSGLTSNDPLFSSERMSETLTGGYFVMLGVMSSSTKGLLLMERWHMINMFYHIVELRERNDLIRALLGNLDYTLDSPLRVILSKALTFCSPETRIFATRVLRRYATRSMRSTDSGNREYGFVQWAIQLLITQLYDPEVEVCEVAIKILEEACNDDDALEYVVRCRPALDHLGEIGAPLLLRFLSTSTGYHYLDGLDYISQEMDDWFLGRNDSYVTLVEASLAKALSTSSRISQQSDEPHESNRNGSIPPHFYRELTRTAEGCRLLQTKGHFNEFVTLVRNHGLENEDSETMLKVKGAMWAIGNVGSMELGAPFLESTGSVKLIIDIAEQSEVFSMRGTAFFVLGLISRSVHGQEIMAEHGWDATVDDIGCSIGICLPTDFGKLLSLKSQSVRSPQEIHNGEVVSPRLEGIKSPTSTTSQSAISTIHEEDSVNTRILHLVKDLGNTVLTKARAAELHSLKAKKVPGFQDSKLFHKVMSILEQHHFRLPVLRFVIDLFDRRVLRHIVLEESDDEENPEENPEAVAFAR